MVPLRPIHANTVYAGGSAKRSLEYWRSQDVPEILESLLPGQPESLRTKDDGRIMNGNTRIKVLKERGIDVDSLPREIES